MGEILLHCHPLLIADITGYFLPIHYLFSESQITRYIVNTCRSNKYINSFHNVCRGVYSSFYTEYFTFCKTFSLSMDQML